MLQHLLQQEGITVSVQGDYLQGAVGGLPAAGLARLLVEDSDYARAREIIQRWEARSTPAPAPATSKARPSGFLTGLLGLVAGALLSYAYFHAPYAVEGVDYNGDGVLDERWTWAPSGTPLKGELDRNLDGQVDAIHRYSREGHISTSQTDDDFDGDFETTMTYRRGNPVRVETDSTGDGFPDLRSHYQNGVMTTQERFAKGAQKPLRIERFHLGRAVSAEIDTDGDGILDTLHEYEVGGNTLSTRVLETSGAPGETR